MNALNKFRLKLVTVFLLLFILMISPMIIESLLTRLGEIEYIEGKITQIEGKREIRIYFEFEIDGVKYSGDNKFFKNELPELQVGDKIYIYYGKWWPSLLHELDAYLMNNIDRKEEIMEQRRNGDIYIVSPR